MGVQIVKKEKSFLLILFVLATMLFLSPQQGDASLLQDTNFPTTIESGITPENWELVLKNATEAPMTSSYDEQEELAMFSDDLSPEAKIGKELFWYAAAVYCNVLNSNLLEWKCGYYCDNAPRGTKVVYPFRNHVLGTEGFVALNKQDNRILVVFEGSVDFNDWVLTNARVAFTPLQLPGPPAFHPDIKVHTGFLEAYNIVQQPLVKTVLELANKLFPNYDVVTIGHSLGGAMSTMFATHIHDKLQNPSRLKVYTYGQPRVGNAAFAKMYDQAGIHTIRYVNEKDLVSHIPPSFTGYMHHGQEAWWTRGSLRECTPVGEDEKCSNSASPAFSVLDHTKYFGIPVNPLKCTLV